MPNRKVEEAKLQSECVIWLWNNYPETRGLFFAVENEGARISPKMVKEQTLFILSNINNPQAINIAARKLLETCTNGNAVGGAQARAMGVTAGVSDCLFMWKNKTYCFEFKTDVGRQSDKQILWESAVKKHGFDYFVVRNKANFVAIIKAIF